MEIKTKLFDDGEIEKYIDEIARLRLTIFREYPYLYDGNKDYEADYLKKFIGTEDSIVVLAFSNDSIIGALTGLPLQYEEPDVCKPWIELDQPLDKLYYFSEGLILDHYRKRGIGRQMFRIAEDWVENTRRYDVFTLATVIRSDDHPKKPENYSSTDIFWEKLGYRKTNGLVCTIPWREIGEDQEYPKPLLFWSKNIG
ncbi:MAG TPA: hypothetical protein VKZ56_00200 [Membranihabitans sp.]|nr:hypothetical protein [Membranihabitans sp.]